MNTKERYTIKFFFSFIFLCGISSNCQATGIKGDSLYVSGHFFEASIEYEHLIFSSLHQGEQNYYKYKKALCYKQLKNFSQAIQELQSIYFQNSQDSLFQKVYYQQALCFYLNEEPIKALWKMDEYSSRLKKASSDRLFLPLKIMCLNTTFQWKESQACLVELINTQCVSPEKILLMKQFVKDLYDIRNLPRIRSSKKAENWSRFIPGSGQIYAGYTGEGIGNFLINGSVLAFSASQAVNGFYITGYLAGLGFFNKTYHGGIKRSGILATRKNKELIVNFNSTIIQMLRSNFVLN